jgi:exoribonuclease R
MPAHDSDGLSQALCIRSAEPPKGMLMGGMARAPKPRNPRTRDDDSTGRSDRELLARVGRSAGGRVGYKQLVRELGLGGGRERRLLLEQLANIVARGDLVRTADQMWSLPRPESTSSSPSKPELRNTPSARTGGHWDGLEAAAAHRGRDRSGRDRLVAGRLDLHRDGFGFVRPDPGGLARPGASQGVLSNNQDIFIPPNEINGAMQGDLVLVNEAPLGRDGRRSGRIARVLTRRNQRSSESSTTCARTTETGRGLWKGPILALAWDSLLAIS